MPIYVYRFLNPTTNERFYTASGAERNYIIENNPSLNYEGVAWTQDETPDTPLYRFFRTDTQTHFYTALASQRQAWLTEHAGHINEEPSGVGVSSFRDASALQAVYRFTDTTNGTEFLTASDGERDFILESLKHYRLEGVAFYAMAAPNPTGTEGKDVIEAAQSAPRHGASVLALGGADTVTGGDGADILAGNAGNDRLQGGDGADTLYGGKDQDTLSGSAGADLLYGDLGADILDGNAGADTLFGGAGDDRLSGSADDLLLGGDGNDSYIVTGSSRLTDSGGSADSVTVSGLTQDTYWVPEGIETVTLEQFNGSNSLYRFNGTGSADRMVVSASGLGNRFEMRGGDGGDTMAGGGATSGREGDTLFGQDGNDHLSALWRAEGSAVYQASFDILDGGIGDDTLVAGPGQDTLVGGSGSDTFLFDASLVSGYDGNLSYIADFQPGIDRIRLVGASVTFQDIVQRATSYSDRFGRTGTIIFTSIGTPIVVHGTHPATLSADWFDLGSTVTGATGNDTYTVTGDTRIVDAGGIDEAIVSAPPTVYQVQDGIETTTLQSFVGENLLYTVTGTDRSETIRVPHRSLGIRPVIPTSNRFSLEGGAGDDTLAGGGQGPNTLSGGDGNDHLSVQLLWGVYPGGYHPSDDLLDGGAGDDTLQATSGQDTLIGGSGADTFLFDATLFIENGTRHGVTGSATITDFETGSDRIRVLGTGLTAQQILDRFADTASGVSATFTVGSRDFEIALGGVSWSSLTAEMFVVS